MANIDTPNSELELQLNIDKTLMFYLSAKTGAAVSEIACTLVDYANRSIERIKKGNNWQNRNRFTYPGSKIVLNATVSKSQDNPNYIAAAHEWMATIMTHANVPKGAIKKNQLWDSHMKHIWRRGIVKMIEEYNLQSWFTSNPYPDQDDYWYLKCTITMSTKDRNIFFTQQNIDDMLIENILFGEEDGNNSK